MTLSTARIKKRFKLWFFEGIKQDKKPQDSPHQQAPWWQVMCLTGVDYFSTLGYQPGIAFLAAGVLSPLATIILVLLTLFGALPIYRRVAHESPHGQGSISMLEVLLKGWRGKALVLCLLGFAATDFMITMTLSAADAAAHVVENPLVVGVLRDRMLVTLFLLGLLGAVFLKGFREAIGLSVMLVSAYLVLNLIVIGVGAKEILQNPAAIADWQHNLLTAHGSAQGMLLLSILLFPKLALGLSGFETGVAVMPLVKGAEDDDPVLPKARIRHTKWLLTLAASIMSFYLIASSFVTTVLIPASAFAEGGPAYGRALAYLAHKYLGGAFGTAYDISTIAILWFAGASAMTGLLNLVPRYLPRYGMAPEWSRAIRPLVVFFTAVAFIITWLFKADVNAQGAAYATGVLVLMSSAAFAVILAAWHEGLFAKIGFSLVFLIFIYTTGANIFERPDGIKIASFFIAVILFTSLVSRALRSTELRIARVELDPQAQQIIAEASKGEIRLLAHRPGGTSRTLKEQEARVLHSIQQDEGYFVFLEVSPDDPSDFIDECLQVQGGDAEGFPVLRCRAQAVPNAIAAILLHIRSKTKKIPHAYFGWTEGHPLAYILKYIFLGEGETAPLTREILRSAESDKSRRPYVHVA